MNTYLTLKSDYERELCLKTQSVPRSKHSVSFIKTSQLMLYREIIAVCSEIRTKRINTLCGQNVGFLSVKPGDIYIYIYIVTTGLYRVKF
jgi:hypothetical protein